MELYKLSAAQHDRLAALNPSVTINLTPSLSAINQLVAITLPYSAFDLNVSWPYGNGPYKNESAYYFPLKRANDTNQYTLGRAFLQEAYLIADYERQNFSVWPCRWDDTTTRENLVPILTNDVTTIRSKSSMGTGTIVGAGVGGAAGLMTLGVIFWLYLRRRSRSRAAEMELQEVESNNSGAVSTHITHQLNKSVLPAEIAGTEKHELHQDHRLEAEPGGKFEMDGSGLPHEVDGEGKNVVYEMDAGGDGVGLVDSHGELVRITIEPATAVTPRMRHAMPSLVSAKSTHGSEGSTESGAKIENEVKEGEMQHPSDRERGQDAMNGEDEKDGVRSFFGFLKAFRASGKT